jgi:hypothetical protein
MNDEEFEAWLYDGEYSYWQAIEMAAMVREFEARKEGGG